MFKQVGPSMGIDHTRTPTPASSVISGSNSSVHSPRTTPGIFSPPPVSQAHHLASAADMGELLYTFVKYDLVFNMLVSCDL